MSIQIHIPSPLRTYCDGASELSITAEVVRDVLDQLEQKFPPMYRSICDETGAVRQHVHLFINNRLIQDLNGLDSSLQVGDVLTIMPAVSGG